jgi:hypothetical protein
MADDGAALTAVGVSPFLRMGHHWDIWRPKCPAMSHALPEAGGVQSAHNGLILNGLWRLQRSQCPISKAKIAKNGTFRDMGDGAHQIGARIDALWGAGAAGLRVWNADR